MVLDAVSNFVRGSTDAAVGTSDTTVSVADASIFPDPETDGEFNVVIWDVNNFPRPDQDGDVEILRVTARDTTADELTVTRGQEMTSAAAHPEGSAIHLSPTAKMFTDIEDTFTTEAEAADAAPVQSVFDRVGDVVAETGDYAATQISNFSSEVLTSISGSTIAPSEITDLWNGTVVTSDVNNTNTTTTALEAESLVNDRIYAGAYAGSDPDARLDNALSDSSGGETIYLEAGQYTSDRTISIPVTIVGTSQFVDGTDVTDDSTWTLDDRGIRLTNLLWRGEKIICDSQDCTIDSSIVNSDVEVEADGFRFYGNRNTTSSTESITFSTDTEAGIVDSTSNFSVTDNGNNTVGDIA